MPDRRRANSACSSTSRQLLARYRSVWRTSKFVAIAAKRSHSSARSRYSCGDFETIPQPPPRVGGSTVASLSRRRPRFAASDTARVCAAGGRSLPPIGIPFSKEIATVPFDREPSYKDVCTSRYIPTPSRPRPMHLIGFWPFPVLIFYQIKGGVEWYWVRLENHDQVCRNAAGGPATRTNVRPPLARWRLRGLGCRQVRE